MSKSKLGEMMEKARSEGRTALIPFLPGGFPDKDRFWDELKALDEGGADVIEIGVPFSDPVADGPVVEAASLECLERGVNLDWILEGLKARKGQFNAALVLMGYYNPFYQYGLKRFARDAREAGVSGCIVPDLPFEESGPMRSYLLLNDLDLVPLVGLNTSEERMRLYAEGARGFAYFVSVLGTTGVRDVLPEEIREKLTLARDVFDIPIALGFGLKSPSQLEALKGLADGAVFGSSLIRHIRQGGGAAEFMSVWRGA